MFKTTLCKRCRCQFMFDGEQFRFRKYCDSCDPIAKQEVRDQYAARRDKKSISVKHEHRRLSDLLQPLTVRTHAQVAKILGISYEAVRQAEISALAKCRKAFQFEMLKRRVENGR